MSLEIFPIDKIPGSELYEYMEEHGLISNEIAADPGRLIGLSQMSDFFVWHEDGEPIGLHIETPHPGGDVIDMTILPADKTLGKRLWNDIVAMGDALREVWFVDRGLRRVQCVVPSSRVNMQRIMRALGFVEETRKMGLRGYFWFVSGGVQDAQIWGMVPGDKAPRERVEIAYEYAGE